ncbi:MAG TPA: hypothetical protein VK179_13030 [Bacteroidales bacterium]|nr:hypothetical protein [Bacteroidales bacterium]
MRYFLLIIVYSLFFIGCASPQPPDILQGYNLDEPDEMFVLPDSLREISGIAPLSDTEFACIQDENGIVFIYDTAKRRIRRQLPFGIDGDFEGIARVQKSLYILRSDGTLYEIEDYRSSPVVNTLVTGIMAGDNEGLCYDSTSNRLLIGSKSKLGNGSGLKNFRGIYSFDLDSKLLSEQPVFSFNVKTLQQFAVKNRIGVPSKITKKGNQQAIIKFRPSDIDFNPLTNDLYVLSSVDHMLFIFNKDGVIKNIQLLDPSLFSKAEGLSFLENGDMVVTNEGETRNATLLLFRHRK